MLKFISQHYQVIISKFLKYNTKTVKKGLLRIMTLPERVRNFILFLFFHFDRWHISPSSNRIYPGAIIDFVLLKVVII
jgi:hypothetical protein